MSKGEFENVVRAVGLQNIVDNSSPLYQQKNLDKIRGAAMIQEIVLEKNLVSPAIIIIGDVVSDSIKMKVFCKEQKTNFNKFALYGKE